ncbi:interleukin-17 receptor C [Varanus komodoensis]|uniref:interleukin-17 receptor C n=1 Tax=Varanus komodoensis TaxID=61221 RepID=UPI001CF7D327|nr:interleukin-17 receptor C [Varanus komodoensis]
MYILTLALVLVYLPSACFQPATFPDSVNCSQGLGCRFLGRDVLCTPGEASPDPKLYPVLVLTQKTRNKLRCRQHQDCTPCVHVMLQLGLTGPPALGTSQELHGDTEELLQMHVFLSVQTHHSSNCLAVEIWLPHRHDWQTRNLGSLHFDCFPVAIGGELHFAAFTLPRYTSADVIRFTHHGPDCTWHKAKNAVRLCQAEPPLQVAFGIRSRMLSTVLSCILVGRDIPSVPNLEVSVDLEKAVLHVRDVPEGQHFNLWLYLNRTGRFEGLGKDNLKLLTGPENMTIPISQVFPCLCLQVWPNVKDQDLSSRTHLCPFANDTEALTRAWAKSHLEVKAFEETVSGSLAGPCDLPGEMVPCWRGELLACHPLHPQLHLALTPRVPQEFPRLRPHPNLCVQVRSNGIAHLQSCLQGYIAGSHQATGHQLLLRETLDFQGNSSFHVLEQSAWVHIAQAVSTRKSILVEALQNDILSGECMQLWHTEGSEATVLWACSLEKYSRTHWALAWMVTVLGTCCILLALVLRKEALKGTRHPPSPYVVPPLALLCSHLI